MKQRRCSQAATLLQAALCVALIGTNTSPGVAGALVAMAAEKAPCDFITESEVRAIVHAPVKARQTGSETCTYALSGPGPYAQVKVARGDGRVAMQVYGRAAATKQGAKDPLAGVGDQAAFIGTALMVRTGEDLVEVTMSGVHQPMEVAKRMYFKVKTRM